MRGAARWVQHPPLRPSLASTLSRPLPASCCNPLQPAPLHPTCSGSMCPPLLPWRASRSSSACAGLSRLGRRGAAAGGVAGASGTAGPAAADEERRADARVALPDGLEGGLAAAGFALPLAPDPFAPVLPLLAPLLSGKAWRASGWGAPRRLAAALRMLQGVATAGGGGERQCSKVALCRTRCAAVVSLHPPHHQPSGAVRLTSVLPPARGA